LRGELLRREEGGGSGGKTAKCGLVIFLHGWTCSHMTINKVLPYV